MQNFIARAMYDGSEFHGFQRQKNAVTVQETIETALSRLFDSNTEIIGCSRTDAGVHALEYIFNFFSETRIPENKLALAVNDKIRNDNLIITDIHKTNMDFNSRFSNKGKRYLYNIWNARIKNPFIAKYSWHIPYELDFSAMERAAEHFIGTYDFSAFMSSGSEVVSTVRTIRDCKVLRSERYKEQIEIEVEADGFLYNMVRIITGTLTDVGKNKLKSDDITGIIMSGKRENAGVTAPAAGLFLKKVYY